MPALAPGSPRQIDLGNPVASVPGNRGVVLWWQSLPNNSGGPAYYDITPGGRYPGTLVAAPPWTETPYGKGVKLNGSSQYVTTATTPLATSPLSMACRFLAASLGGDQTILAVGRAGQTDSWVRLITRSDGTLRLNVGDSSGSQASADSAAGAVATSVWYDALVTFDFGVGTVYLNGSQVAQGVSMGNTFNAFDYFAAGVLRFSVDLQFWPGSVVSPKLWNRVLSATEAMAEYREALSSYPTELRRFTPRVRVFGGTSTSPPPSGRLARPCSLDGLGGAGQQSFNPSLGV